MKRTKWNHNLDRIVRMCLRRVFYGDRYAHPNGKASSPQRQVFLLKQALDLTAWRGKLVHTAIQKQVIPSLQKDELPNFSEVQRWVLDLVDRQYKFSKTERYNFESKTSAGEDYCVLYDDYRGDGVSVEDIEEVKKEVKFALENLEDFFIKLLVRARKAVKLEGEMEIRFSIDERIRMEAILDMVFQEDDNRIVIVDWKVGDALTGNAREQLFAYAYALLKSGWWDRLRCEDFELIEANLITGEQVRYTFTEEDLADVDDRIFTGSQLLKPIYEHPVKNNIPEDFAPAESPGSCEGCPVREICNGSLSEKAFAQPGLQYKLF